MFSCNLRRSLALLFLVVSSFLVLAELGKADTAHRIEWNPPKDIAVGHGVKGPWKQNDSEYDYVDDPSVVIGDAGKIMIAWVDQSKKDVLFEIHSEEGAKKLGKTINVSKSPETFSWLPRLATAPDSPATIYLLWQEIIFSGGSHGGDILFSRSVDDGKTFSEPINLSRSIGGDGKGRIDEKTWSNGSLDLIAGPKGSLVAAWTEYHGVLWVSRSSDGGQSFSAPTRVAGTNERPARAPTLARAPDGTTYLAWTHGEATDADIMIQKVSRKSSDKGTAVGDARPVAKTKGFSDSPKIAVDSKGRIHLVYAESDAGPFGEYHVRYTRSIDGGKTFGAPIVVSNFVPGTYESSGYPAIAIHGENTLLVSWELYPSSALRPSGIGIAVSGNGGESFAPPIVVPGSQDPAGGTNGSHQGLLMQKLAVGEKGQIAIVNSSLSPGKNSRIWLMTGTFKSSARVTSPAAKSSERRS